MACTLTIYLYTLYLYTYLYRWHRHTLTWPNRCLPRNILTETPMWTKKGTKLGKQNNNNQMSEILTNCTKIYRHFYVSSILITIGTALVSLLTALSGCSECDCVSSTNKHVLATMWILKFLFIIGKIKHHLLCSKTYSIVLYPVTSGCELHIISCTRQLQISKKIIIIRTQFEQLQDCCSDRDNSKRLCLQFVIWLLK